jgi:fermentation-respiration switch protein FrsA (DUF1100 family)
MCCMHTNSPSLQAQWRVKTWLSMGTESAFALACALLTELLRAHTPACRQQNPQLTLADLGGPQQALADASWPQLTRADPSRADPS